MTGRIDLASLLAEHIRKLGSQWSLGTFGGIAEFSRDPDEDVVLDVRDANVSAVTSRGGIRIKTNGHIVPFASESISRNGWSHRVALCLPADECVMHQRTQLTEIGRDDHALRADDCAGTLFDLGLGARQADLCIRTADERLIGALRECCGRSIFASDNGAMALIVANAPHRVFISRIGRAEVYQVIPPAGGRSPDGPHTHVLPKLLALQRTHPATEPIPEGLVPCAHLYPAHPLRNSMGQPRPFDPNDHFAFQNLLVSFGDQAALDLKMRVTSLVADGEFPQATELPDGKRERSNIRLALRQFEAQNAPSAALKAWLAVYERHDADPDEDQLTLGH